MESDSGVRTEPAAVRVTVIVPAYNGAATLSDTLDCLLAQTLTAFRVIVVDDGSTDTTVQLVQSYVNRDARFRLLSKPNSGVADARNLAIQMADTELIAPLDADDIWHPDYLKLMCGTLLDAGPETAFVYANFRIIDPFNKVIGSAPVYAVQGRILNQLLIRNFVGNGSGMVFRRAAALAVGGYERRLQHEFAAQGCEDWLLQIRLAARWRVAVVPRYLVGYRHLPGAMSRSRTRMQISHIKALELFMDEMGGADPVAVRWATAMSCFESALAALHEGKYAMAATYLWRSFRMDPGGSLTLALRDKPLHKLRQVVQRLQWLTRPARAGRRYEFDSLAPDEAPGRVPVNLTAQRVVLAQAYDGAALS